MDPQDVHSIQIPSTPPSLATPAALTRTSPPAPRPSARSPRPSPPAARAAAAGPVRQPPALTPRAGCGGPVLWPPPPPRPRARDCRAQQRAEIVLRNHWAQWHDANARSSKWEVRLCNLQCPENHKARKPRSLRSEQAIIRDLGLRGIC